MGAAARVPDPDMGGPAVGEWGYMKAVHGGLATRLVETGKFIQSHQVQRLNFSVQWAETLDGRGPP